MRIIHVIDYFQPQLGYQETFLAREHSRMGHEVHVITSDRYYPFPHYEETVAPLLGPRQLIPGIYKEDGVTIHRLPARFEYRTRVWLKGLKTEIEAIQPDVIYAHGIENIASFRLARWKLKNQYKCSLIYDCHMIEMAAKSKLSSLFRSVYRHFLKQWILNAADALVAVSDTTKEYMETAYGIPSYRIQMIPLGVDTESFHRNTEIRMKMRSNLGIDSREVAFIYVGKVIAEKGVHLLAKAVQQMLKDDPNLRLKVLIVGGGPAEYRERIMRDLPDVDLAEKFIWIGVVPNAELPKYYSAADIGVWPREVTITQLEAMSCELPIIVADNPAAAERVAWGNGLIYKEGDVEDLCRAMKQLLNDEKL
ncbi:MAG: hypothetical protein DRI26_06535, partial [Chloroflexi bacterium]